MSSPLPVSAAIITLNEEANLPRCLESVRALVREIVVIDSGSTDRTREVAQRYQAIFETHPWPGHVAQKNRALSRCTEPWVLCLDADEAVSPELAASIRNVFAPGEPAEAGFLVNRLNYYQGRWIRHAWYPEWRLRLVRRDRAKWGGMDPHDKLETTGPTRRIEGNLLHWPFKSVQDHFQSTLDHARTMAESYARAGRGGHLANVVFSPWVASAKILILKGGWRDGWRGWVIAGAKWMNVFAKYAFLIERRWTNSKEKNHT